MNILGIIPARYASTRFPGKPLADINGKTMIRRVYEQALKAGTLSGVIVATDDIRIYDEVTSWGGRVAMTSAHHQNGTERCAEVVSSQSGHIDVVINIQGDMPFINPEEIDSLASLFQNPDCLIATLIKEYQDKELIKNPSVVKVAVDRDLHALYFSRSPIPCHWNAGGKVSFYKHIGLYGYWADILADIVHLAPTPLETAENLEQLRWLENGYAIHAAITEYESISIDLPEDLEQALARG